MTMVWRGRQLAAMAGVLAACGSGLKSTQFRGADGSTDWWTISCGGDGSLCQREAGEVCPHGYNTSERDPKGRKLTIQCKGGSGPAVVVDPACGGAQPVPLDCDEQLARAKGRDFLVNDPRERAAGAAGNVR